MRKIGLLISVFACVMLFYGCGKTVATVNGQSVTQRDLDRELERAAGKNMLDTLIGRKLVEEDAATKHIKVADKEIDQQLNELKKSFSETDQQSLVGDRLKSLRNEIQFNILLRQAIMANVPDSELKAYYEKNKDVLPQLELSVIVVGDPKQAQAIVDELHRGKDFAALASQFSLDPAGRERAGYIGFVPLGTLNQLSPFLAKAAMMLKPGDISPVIQTQKGYYILKVLSKRDSYDQLKPEIERQMASDRAKTYLESLREKAKIEYKGEYAKK